eukprot:1991248-Pyramimonas_sp.AAC.1
MTDCSGIEAPLQALSGLGVDIVHVAASENSKSLQKFLGNNFKPVYFFKDMLERDDSAIDSPIDVYIAGPPCQTFSRAGRHGGDGALFNRCIDTIVSKRPRVFLLENVDGLVARHGSLLESFITRFKDDG